MSFLTLSAFAFLALCPVVVFLYFLKLKRTEHVISTTMLWQKSIDDMRANAPFQRLRRNLLMILQLLIIALLVLALARPFLSASPVKGRSVAILIDNSASMNVGDEDGKTRLERARELAREIVGQVKVGPLVGPRRPGLARAMVISFNNRTVIRCSFTENRRVLNQAIDSIEPTDTGTSVREALSIALGAAKGQASPEVLVLSDGAFADAGRTGRDADKAVPIRYVMLGSSADNVGIATLSVRRQVEGGRGFEVFASVRNFRDTKVATTADLYLEDKLLDAKQIEVEPNAGRAVIFQHFRDETGVLKLKLNVTDSLEADNVAHAVLREDRLVKALLVSEGNFFLEKAIALGPMVELSRIAPSAATEEPPKGYDFVVFDHCAPKKLTAGNYLFLNTPPPVQGVEAGAQADKPVLIDWDPTHPVTRFLNFDPVYVHRSRKVKLPKAFHVLLESTAGPLLACLETSDLRVLYLAFDPYESSWPFRVSFPVFVANVTGWLARTGEQTGGGKTGRPAELDLPAETRQATIVDPRGESHAVRIAPGGRAAFKATDWAGVYKVNAHLRGRRKPEVRRFAANLLSEAESNIRPRPHLRVNAAEIARASGSVMQKEVWTYFALAALALIMIEWAVYHRRFGV